MQSSTHVLIELGQKFFFFFISAVVTLSRSSRSVIGKASGPGAVLGRPPRTYCILLGVLLVMNMRPVLILSSTQLVFSLWLVTGTAI